MYNREKKMEEKYVEIDTPKVLRFEFFIYFIFSVLSSFHLSKDYISTLSTKKKNLLYTEFL